jgi:phospholipase C
MEFITRDRETIVELDPGQTKTWRLLPATAGVFLIDSSYAKPIGGESSEGTSSGGTPGLTAIHVGAEWRRVAEWSFGRSVGTGTGTESGTVARERNTNDIRPGRGGVRETFPGDGGVGGGTGVGEPEIPGGGDTGGWSGPTMELNLELLRGGQVVGSGSNHILHTTQNAGDIWALRVTRKQDGSTEHRRYKIRVLQPSILVREERRIPMSFFNRGFDLNWNDKPLLAWMDLRDGVLSYQWEPNFAQMHGKPSDEEHEQLGLPGWVKFPNLRSIKLVFSAHGGKHPIADNRRACYLQARIVAKYVDPSDRTIKIDPPVLPGGSVDVISLPAEDKMYFDVKFYIEVDHNGKLSLFPKVESPILDLLDFDITYVTLGGTETKNAKDEVCKALESFVHGLQFKLNPGGLGFYLKPYLVGNYEAALVTHDRRSDEMVITYVGRQKRETELEAGQSTVVSAGDPSTHSWLTEPRLFDVPAEMLLPNENLGRDPEIRRDVQPGALDKIEHVVVLMMENRSFDQILGYLSKEGMLPRNKLLVESGSTDPAPREAPQAHVDGLLPGQAERDMNSYPPGDAARKYFATRTFKTSWPSYKIDGPWHGAEAVDRQIANGMKGFVGDFAKHAPAEHYGLVMQYLTDKELPAYGLLAREFAICDRWHCSHIGGTLPNRFISLTGDLSSDVFGAPELENPELSGKFFPLETSSFFDHLSKKNVKWKLYEHNYSTIRLLRNYTFDTTNVVGFNHFIKDCHNGTLPAVAFIEPDYIESPMHANDDHAPADMQNGQTLVAKIMLALLDNEDVWKKTVFIITYDEHGGFFDHAPLPSEMQREGQAEPVKIPPLANGERRLGVRVPAFVISPFIKPMSDGKVNCSHLVYDHTSITATILRRFCGPRLPNMGGRVAEMPDVRDLLVLDRPRSFADFEQLRREMKAIAERGDVPTPSEQSRPVMLSAPTGEQAEDWKGLVTHVSTLTGAGTR